MSGADYTVEMMNCYYETLIFIRHWIFVRCNCYLDCSLKLENFLHVYRESLYHGSLIGRVSAQPLIGIANYVFFLSGIASPHVRGI